LLKFLLFIWGTTLKKERAGTLNSFVRAVPALLIIVIDYLYLLYHMVISALETP